MADVIITTLPADVTITDALDNVLVIDAPKSGFPKDGNWESEFVIEALVTTGTIALARGQVASADSSLLAAGEKPVILTLRGNDDSGKLNFKGQNGDKFRISA